MGTLSYTVGRYAPSRGAGAGSIAATSVRTSGAHATTTSASAVTDGSGAIALAAGEVIEVHADEDMRLAFGGVAATASTGWFVPAGHQRQWECDTPGAVSVIDVA